MKEVENGPWGVGTHLKGIKSDEIEIDVYIQSDDFTHDVSFTINGDFKDLEQKQNYAEEIVKRLNAYNQGEPK